MAISRADSCYGIIYMTLLCKNKNCYYILLSLCHGWNLKMDGILEDRGFFEKDGVLKKDGGFLPYIFSKMCVILRETHRTTTR